MRTLPLSLILLVGCGPEKTSRRSDMTAPQRDAILYGANIESLSAEGDEHSFRLKFVAARGDVRYVVSISEKDFVRAGHKVEIREGSTYVDGTFAIGTDGYAPNSELTELSISADAKELYVPDSLYKDCYNQWMSQGGGSDVGNVYGLVVRILDDGRLVISAPGSDGAGTYVVHWWIGGIEAPTRSVVVDEDEIMAFCENWRTKVPDRPRIRVAPEKEVEAKHPELHTK